MTASRSNGHWKASNGRWCEATDEGRFPKAIDIFKPVAGRAAVSINAKYLSEIVAAVGSLETGHEGSVTLFFDTNNWGGGIGVLGSDGIGVLMPLDNKTPEKSAESYDQWAARFREAWESSIEFKAAK